MKFAQTFIKHHVMTILLYILVVVFGFYSFQNLPLALMPSMEVPAAVVYATYPGAGPEDIEQQVTKKLEGAVAGLSGLDTLQSTSSENMAMLVIRFTNDTDMDQAMTDLRDKVAQVKSQLPDDASDPTVMSIDIDSMPVVSVALRGNDLASLQSIAEDEIQPALERLDGVASVDISGGYEQEIAVHTDASRLKGYNLTISSIGQQLGADNIAIPGGDLDNGSQTLAVRTDGEYSSIDDVKNALISLPAGGTVRLSQIADVSMQPKDQDAISKVDGEECIILSVNKQSGSNTAQIAELAKAEFDSLLKSNDSLQWNIVMDQSDYINMTVDNAIQNIWMGVLFAAIVLFLFLRDFGATMAVTIAMPCCILFTFLIMNVLGITLNMMSLGGIRGFEYSNPDYLANAKKVDEIIHSDLFRPPHGHMGFRQYYTLRHHYRIIMWDLVTRDYSKCIRPEQVLDNVKHYVRNGSIITFHDSLKSWNNGNLQYALPRAIEFLKAEGYEFKVF